MGSESSYELHFCMTFCTCTLVHCHIPICVLNTYFNKIYWYFTLLNKYYYLFDIFICKNYIFSCLRFDRATIFIFLTKFLLFEVNFNLICYFINILLLLGTFWNKTNKKLNTVIESIIVMGGVNIKCVFSYLWFFHDINLI